VRHSINHEVFARGNAVDKGTLLKIDRLLKRFPEVWTHVAETGGGDKVFHHVDYKSSNVEGRSRVRLVSHVSPEMCDLLVLLKNHGAEMVALSREALASKTTAQKPYKIEDFSEGN
jgi:hypothetical protein